VLPDINQGKEKQELLYELSADFGCHGSKKHTGHEGTILIKETQQSICIRSIIAKLLSLLFEITLGEILQTTCPGCGILH
jgi:hypothetical protein